MPQPATRLAAAILLAILTFVHGPECSKAADDDWSARQKQFKDAWEIGGAGNPNLRTKLREGKRSAVALLGGLRDGRAVPLLLSAHRAS